MVYNGGGGVCATHELSGRHGIIAGLRGCVVCSDVWRTDGFRCYGGGACRRGRPSICDALQLPWRRRAFAPKFGGGRRWFLRTTAVVVGSACRRLTVRTYGKRTPLPRPQAFAFFSGGRSAVNGVR